MGKEEEEEEEVARYMHMILLLMMMLAAWWMQLQSEVFIFRDELALLSFKSHYPHSL